MLTWYELAIGDVRFELLLTPRGGIVINKETDEVHGIKKDDLEYVLSIKGSG